MPKKRTHQLARLLAVLGLAMGASCKKPALPVPPPTPIDHPVTYSGCAAMRIGPICEVAKGKSLHVWLPTGERAESFTIDGKPLVPNVQEGVAGGDLYELSTTPPANELLMLVRAGEKRETWRLKLAAETPLPPVVAEAHKLAREGDPTAAEKLLRRELISVTGDERCMVIGELGRVLSLIDRFDEAVPLFNESIPCNENAGRITRATNETLSLIHLYVETLRLAEARKELERLSRWVGFEPFAAAGNIFYQVAIARAAEDARTVLRLAPEAENAARRAADPALLSYVQLERATVLCQIGRPEEALAILRADPSEGRTPALRALWLNRIGFAMLLLRELGNLTDDPRPMLDQSAALYHQVGDAEQEAVLLTYAARVTLAAGDAAVAAAYLARARATHPHPNLDGMLDRSQVEAEVRLSAGDPSRALVLFRDLGALANEAGRPDRSWTAKEGEARALLKMGRRSAATAAFSEAEALLSTASRAVPLGEGRDAYLAAREKSAKQRLEALIDVDAAAAFRAAREARARILTDAQMNDRLAQLSPDARARFEEKLGEYKRARGVFDAALEKEWELNATALAAAGEDRRKNQREVGSAYEAALAALPPPIPFEPAPPAAGELWLGFFPLVDGWAGFAATNRGVRAVRLGAVSPHASTDVLASRLLEPFHTEIASAKRIVLLPSGPLTSVDFHALPFGGRPLVTHAAVEYALDLGAKASHESASGIFVVADPRGDLPRAREEADAIASVATKAGIVRRLFGAQATRAAVEDGLRNASLFYYAGHGAFAGRDGWDSSLLLAENSTLGAGDILTLPSVPATVILSGCETARTTATDAGGSASAAAERLGIAQALLIAGSNRAIATSRDVADTDALRISRQIYTRIADGEDVAEALRGAQLEAVGGTADWAAFRALRR